MTIALVMHEWLIIVTQYGNRIKLEQIKVKENRTICLSSFLFYYRLWPPGINASWPTKKIVKPYFLEEMKSISIETGCDCVWQQLNILNENEEHMEAIAYVLMTFSAFLLLLKTNVIWMLKVSNALEMSQITQKSRFWVAQLFTVIKVFGSYGI